MTHTGHYPKTLPCPEPPSGAWSPSRLMVIDSVDSLSSLTSTISFPHKTREILSIVCISGSVEVNYDSRTMHVGKNSIMVLLPGHIIESYHTSADFRGFMIVSTPENFSNIMPMMSRMLICSINFKDCPVIKLNDEELSNQILLHKLLHNKLDSSRSTLDSLVISKLCESVLCETINVYFSRLQSDSTAQCRRSETLFYNFILNLEKNFISERGVAFYANALCVTPKHLSTAVKEISGRTAGDWIDAYVIEEIKRLLEGTDLTIQEISCRMKFANQSFFGKYFKSHTGMSPRQYRTSVYK